MIENNIKDIFLEIKNTDTKLIAVSKMQSIDKILIAYKAGVRDFGENKVQELLSKIDNLPSDIRWHMIGHLQSNKVRNIIDKVVLIHSVDSIKLASVIDKEAKKKGIIVDILLEVNIGLEDSKYGFRKDDLDKAINDISCFNNVRVKGFMCVAPNNINGEDNRKYFININK